MVIIAHTSSTAADRCALFLPMHRTILLLAVLSLVHSKAILVFFPIPRLSLNGWFRNRAWRGRHPRNFSLLYEVSAFRYSREYDPYPSESVTQQSYGLQALSYFNSIVPHLDGDERDLQFDHISVSKNTGNRRHVLGTGPVCQLVSGSS